MRAEATAVEVGAVDPAERLLGVVGVVVVSACFGASA